MDRIRYTSLYKIEGGKQSNQQMWTVWLVAAWMSLLAKRPWVIAHQHFPKTFHIFPCHCHNTTNTTEGDLSWQREIAHVKRSPVTMDIDLSPTGLITMAEDILLQRKPMLLLNTANAIYNSCRELAISAGQDSLPFTKTTWHIIVSQSNLLGTSWKKIIK